MKLDTSLNLIIEVLTIFLIIVAVSAMISGFEDYTDKNYRNARSLESHIETICQTPGSVTETFNFEQPSVPTLHGMVFSAIEFMLKDTGDPKYLLYYESFPPGEAFGWEVYQGFPNRYIAPFIPDESLENFKEQWSQYVEQFKTEFEPGPAVLPSNIILDSVESRGAITKESWIPGSIGEWVNNTYVFMTGAGLSSLEKSLVKYRACGENTLCLKTPNGIKKLDLKDYCNDIKDVRIRYDDSLFPGAEGHQSNFYVASPCKGLEVTISKKPLSNCGNCDNYYTYPLFKYNKSEDKLERAGEHIQCTDRLLEGEKAPSQSVGGQCIEIHMKSKEDGFCFLSNKNNFKVDTTFIKEQFLNWFETTTPNPVSTIEGTIGMVYNIYETATNEFKPVTHTSSYLEEKKAFKLVMTEPIKKAHLSNENIWKHILNWAWPFSRATG